MFWNFINFVRRYRYNELEVGNDRFSGNSSSVGRGSFNTRATLNSNVVNSCINGHFSDNISNVDLNDNNENESVNIGNGDNDSEGNVESEITRVVSSVIKHDGLDSSSINYLQSQSLNQNDVVVSEENTSRTEETFSEYEGTRTGNGNSRRRGTSSKQYLEAETSNSSRNRRFSFRRRRSNSSSTSTNVVEDDFGRLSRSSSSSSWVSLGTSLLGRTVGITNRQHSGTSTRQAVNRHQNVEHENTDVEYEVERSKGPIAKSSTVPSLKKESPYKYISESQANFLKTFLLSRDENAGIKSSLDEKKVVRELFPDLMTSTFTILKNFLDDVKKIFDECIQLGSKQQEWNMVFFGNGSSYQGFSSELSVMQHFGVYSWRDGHHYTGRFLNGNQDSLGLYTWPTQGKFFGFWKQDKMNGLGIYMSREGIIFYGNWVNDVQDGRGIKILPAMVRYGKRETVTEERTLIEEWENLQLKHSRHIRVHMGYMLDRARRRRWFTDARWAVKRKHIKVAKNDKLKSQMIDEENLDELYEDRTVIII